MGWAIQRGDQTYRSWYAAGRASETLQAGESWVELPTMPAVTVPPPALTPLAQALDTALAGGVTPAQLKTVLQAWRAMVS